MDEFERDEVAQWRSGAVAQVVERAREWCKNNCSAP
jgi:hypothetical protein